MPWFSQLIYPQQFPKKTMFIKSSTSIYNQSFDISTALRVIIVRLRYSYAFNNEFKCNIISTTRWNYVFWNGTHECLNNFKVCNLPLLCTFFSFYTSTSRQIFKYYFRNKILVPHSKFHKFLAEDGSKYIQKTHFCRQKRILERIYDFFAKLIRKS